MSDLKELSCYGKCEVSWPDHSFGQCLKVYIDSEQDGCKGEWKIMDHINSGFNGSVYRVCNKSSCEFVLKYVSMSMGPDEDEDDEDGKMEIEQMKEEFDREVHIQMVVCAAGLAPHIWQIIETDEGAGIIMDAMDETLMDRILRDRRHVDDHIVAAKELLLKLHSLGIYHGDAHPRNFMYKGDKLFLVDFGEARFIKPNTLKYAKNDITRLTEDLDRML